VAFSACVKFHLCLGMAASWKSSFLQENTQNQPTLQKLLRINDFRSPLTIEAGRRTWPHLHPIFPGKIVHRTAEFPVEADSSPASYSASVDTKTRQAPPDFLGGVFGDFTVGAEGCVDQLRKILNEYLFGFCLVNKHHRDSENGHFGQNYAAGAGVGIMRRKQGCDAPGQFRVVHDRGAKASREVAQPRREFRQIESRLTDSQAVSQAVR
jgi:hypothetical protein